MRLAVMQPYFFPYLGYFQLIDAADRFVVYGNFNFRKSSWITRNQVIGKTSKKPIWIRADVSGQSSFTRIRDIRVLRDGTWRRRTLETIDLNYRHAPHFNEIYPALENMIHRQEQRIGAYNLENIREMCSLIGIDTPVVRGDDMFLDVEEGLQERAKQAGLEPMEQRIIEFCQREGAGAYLNPMGGTELYRRESFEKNGLKLRFVGPTTEAVQAQGRPLASIIDTLMHLGAEGTRELLKARREITP